MKKMILAVLAGGLSPESEVSLSGASQVCAALDPEKYDIRNYDPKTDLAQLIKDAPEIDMALLILHGPYGEDGTIQGLLELLGIPYQGSPVLGSAVAMNKLATKQLYQQADIPVVPYRSLKRNTPYLPSDFFEQLGDVLFVKPVHGGSSIGTTFASSIAELEKAIALAFEYDDTILIETCIKGTELTCGVLGNETLEVLPVVEIIPDALHHFFDYEAKYTKGVTQEICPARIDDAVKERVQAIAMQAHKALFLRGYSRTDMILKENELYVLETNTIPGMTSNSLFPLAARAAGMSFSQLLDRLIELGLAAHSAGEKNKL